MEFRAARSRLLVDTERCSGCGTCELACSYHQAGNFSTNFSSVHVDRNHRTAQIQFTLESTCDSCLGEPTPLCIKYCLYDAICMEEEKC